MVRTFGRLARKQCLTSKLTSQSLPVNEKLTEEKYYVGGGDSGATGASGASSTDDQFASGSFSNSGTELTTNAVV
jgi:hypothetical protein